MIAYWNALAVRFAALSRRERWMILAAGLVVVIAVLNVLVVEPVVRKHRAVQSSLSADQASLATLQQQLQVLQSAPIPDPDLHNHQRLEELLEQLRQANASLVRVEKKLIRPEKMPVMLEDILRKHGQLKLVSLKTLPVGEVTLQKASSPAGIKPETAPQSGVYRHGVELKISGRYLDLMQYLQALEQLSWHVLWGGASLTADGGGQSTLTVTIYTLSLDKVWLSI